MSIETSVTHAWQRQALWLWLLLPISWLYGLIVTLRRQAYQRGVLPSYRAPIPVMVIGNITVGGSGKTPLIITLVHKLQAEGIKVGVISRGYGGDTSQMPALVTASSLPSAVGDEPCLIAHSTGAPMAVCPNRQQAITAVLEAHPEIQLIIADDGLQHYALQRDIEWIVVDTARGFGNGQLLPTGFLREPRSRLKNATVIYHETLKAGAADDPADDSIDNTINPISNRSVMCLVPDKLQRLWHTKSHSVSVSIDMPQQGDRVHAVSGIGYPQRFFDTLRARGFDVEGHAYPDHYPFGLAELLAYRDDPIIITSKDAIKISALLRTHTATHALSEEYQAQLSRVWVLPVTAVLSEHCYENLYHQLKTLGIESESESRLI